MFVVGEEDEAELVERRVRRRGQDHLVLTTLHGPLRLGGAYTLRVDAGDVDAVRLLQPGLAVGPLNALVARREPYRKTGRAEVAERLQVMLPGIRRRHREGVLVDGPAGVEDGEAARCGQRSERLHRGGEIG